LRVTPGRLGAQPVALPLVVSPGAAPLRLGGTRYRGTLTFTRGSSGTLQAIDTLDLELYVRAVVSIECPGTWRQAALRAQAVASRSYVLANLRPQADFDVFADDRSQNYRGMSRELPAATAAAAATRHEILTYEGAVVDAFFSASNGGTTSDGQEAWGATRLPYFVSRPDPFDAKSPAARWGPLDLPLARVRRALPALTADLSTVTLVRGADGRVTRLTFVAGDGTRATVEGYAFQQRLGLRSTYFSLAAEYGSELLPAVEIAPAP
jgi:stage II sporulation protein D